MFILFHFSFCMVFTQLFEHHFSYQSVINFASWHSAICSSDVIKKCNTTLSVRVKISTVTVCVKRTMFDIYHGVFFWEVISRVGGILSSKGKGKGAVPNAGRRRGAHLPFLGLWARRWLNHCLWHMASASPDLRLPSQPQSVTALRPVPSYTAW